MWYKKDKKIRGLKNRMEVTKCLREMKVQVTTQPYVAFHLKKIILPNEMEMQKQGSTKTISNLPILHLHNLTPDEIQKHMLHYISLHFAFPVFLIFIFHLFYQAHLKKLHWTAHILK